MQNLVKFTLIFIVLVIAVLLTLSVAGVLSSDELRDNILTVGKIVGIVFISSSLILLISNRK